MTDANASTLQRDYNAHALLDWYVASGIDTIESADAGSFFDWPAQGFPVTKARAPVAPIATSPTIAPNAQPQATPKAISADDAPMPTEEAAALARTQAAACETIDALCAAITAFDGCTLKPGARSTVIYDGVFGANVLIIGEAPDKDDDRLGKPFAGAAGALLDRMLKAVSATRTADDDLIDVCLTNAVYWRPPGNRPPTKAESAICLPFLQRFIALSAPKLILLAGNTPYQALFPGAPGIARSRGEWRTLALADGGEIPVLPMFHPSFLLLRPGQKRLAWQDLLAAFDRVGFG